MNLLSVNFESMFMGNWFSNSITYKIDHGKDGNFQKTRQIAWTFSPQCIFFLVFTCQLQILAFQHCGIWNQKIGVSLNPPSHEDSKKLDELNLFLIQSTSPLMLMVFLFGGLIVLIQSHHFDLFITMFSLRFKDRFQVALWTAICWNIWACRNIILFK